MMTPIDLHIHSACSSDGEFSPEALVGQCAERGLRAFAITDHNSVRAVGPAARQAPAAGLRFIPGIEIDCNYAGTDLHLLGYGIDYASVDFARLEAAVREKVAASFGAMIDNLHRLGFRVNARAVLEAAGEQLPTGELIAEVMLADPECDTPLLAPYKPGGSRSDMPYINFYLDYFAQGRPAFVPVAYMDFREAVQLVRDNGGIPIVAHPGLNLRGRERIVEELLDRGAAGLEVFNNYHSAEQAAWFARTVTRRKAWMTCGSDFHGKTKPRIAIGEFPRDERYDGLLFDFVDHVDMVFGQRV